MTKTFIRDNKEYTVTPCTAIALTIGDTERQNAVHVSCAYYDDETGYSSEKDEYVVFGWTADMLEDEEDFDSMCEDSMAWDSDCETLETVELK